VLAAQLLVRDPSERPSADKLLLNPYVRKHAGALDIALSKTLLERDRSNIAQAVPEMMGTVRVFRQKSTLYNAIWFPRLRATNGIPLRWPLPLTVTTVTSPTEGKSHRAPKHSEAERERRRHRGDGGRSPTNTHGSSGGGSTMQGGGSAQGSASSREPWAKEGMTHAQRLKAKKLYLADRRGDEVRDAAGDAMGRSLAREEFKSRAEHSNTASNLSPGGREQTSLSQGSRGSQGRERSNLSQRSREQSNLSGGSQYSRHSHGSNGREKKAEPSWITEHPDVFPHGTVRIFRNRDLHSRMPLSFMPLLRLKRCHARDQWHSSRVFTPLTGWHCTIRPNTVGTPADTMGETGYSSYSGGGYTQSGGSSMFSESGRGNVGAGTMGYGARFSDRNLHSRMPLVLTPARLKFLHVCDQWQSSRVFTHLTG
jgi:hypothetical protein